MIRSSKGKGSTETKQEDEPDNNNNKTTQSAAAIAATSSSSRQWSAFRNPRIVRVSRTFGGKDRHSKVCTIRGLRDRRIRLSVPTAIQLYDLQDRLGLTQPSKVIDWLLDNTKDDIDSLPPLQMPQGFGQFHHQISPSISPLFDMNLHHHNLGIKMNSSSSFDAAEGSYCGKGKLVRTNEEQQEEDRNRLSLSAAKLFPSAATNSSMPSFFNIGNNPPNLQLNPYNYQWDASNLSLSQFGMLPQNNSISLNTNNGSSGTVSLPPISSGAGGSQFFYCPPTTLPSFFPQYPPPFAHLENNETREISHFQLLNSGFGDSQRNSSARQGHKDQNGDP